jgi:hypothetical protein
MGALLPTRWKMAVRKFVFLDPSTGQYKEQTGSDTIQVANGVDALDAVNKSQLDAAASTAAGAVAAEQARAEAAEGVIAANLASEISARQAAVSAIETTLNNEIARATAADAAHDAAIAAETSARIAAVSAEAAARAAAVSAEQTRAEAAESALSSSIATEVSERTAAVLAEKSRAEIAEGLLSDKIDLLNASDATSGSVAYAVKTAKDYLKGLIDAEVSRAQGAESTLTTELASESARALAAEGVLDGKIATEKTRAEAAEASLSSAISAEQSARISAVSSLTSSLNSEISRAEAAESALSASLAAEVTRAQAAEGVLTSDLAAETSARIAGDASTLAAAKLYADGLTTGLKFKDSVRIALPTQFVMEGVTVNLPADFGNIVGQTDLVKDDRVLLISPNETSGAVNSGIYVVAAGGTSLVRASDMALGSDASGAYVYVEEGDFTPGVQTKAAGTAYVCNSTKGQDIVGTASLKWAVFSRMENLSFANGFSKSGQLVSAVVKSDGAIGVGASGFELKIGDSSHLMTDSSGLKLKGALVGGEQSFADAEHVHAFVAAEMAWSSAEGTFAKMDGTNAGYNSSNVLGFVKKTGGGKSTVVVSGVVEKSASSFSPGDTLYLNSTGDGFVAFGDIPGGKYAIPVGKKLDGTKILVAIGQSVLKA